MMCLVDKYSQLNYGGNVKECFVTKIGNPYNGKCYMATYRFLYYLVCENLLLFSHVLAFIHTGIVPQPQMDHIVLTPPDRVCFHMYPQNIYQSCNFTVCCSF